MLAAETLKALEIEIREFSPDLLDDRIAARQLARDLKADAVNGVPYGWKLYRTFRRTAEKAGLLSSDAHFVVEGAA